MITGPIRMVKSDELADWYTIERAEHDGRYWLEHEEDCTFLRYSGRICDADVEGTADEMRQIAEAILARDEADFKRCAVDATGLTVRLWSPRNGSEEAEVSFTVADEFARTALAMLATYL